MFQEIHYLILNGFTSDKKNTAFEHAFCFFIEVESICSDAGVECCSVEEVFDHGEEDGSSFRGRAILERLIKSGDVFGDLCDHE